MHDLIIEFRNPHILLRYNFSTLFIVYDYELYLKEIILLNFIDWEFEELKEFWIFTVNIFLSLAGLTSELHPYLAFVALSKQERHVYTICVTNFYHQTFVGLFDFLLCKFFLIIIYLNFELFLNGFEIFKISNSIFLSLHCFLQSRIDIINHLGMVEDKMLVISILYSFYHIILVSCRAACIVTHLYYMYFSKDKYYYIN